MKPLAAVWICWAIVGLSPIAGKIAAPLVSAPLLVFLGTILASLYFLPWALKHKKWGELFARGTFWKFLFIGTFGTALPFSILLFALHYTTPGNAAILQQSELLYSLLFATLFLKERLTRHQLAGSMLVVLGAILVLRQDLFSPHWQGDLLILGSTWMFQATSSVAKKLPPELDAYTIALARNLFALPALFTLLLVMYATGESWVWVANIQLFSVLAYTGILKYALAMVMWYKAIRTLDLSKVTAIYLSYPALSLCISTMLGLETPTRQQLAGLLFSMAGAYWISRNIKKTTH